MIKALGIRDGKPLVILGLSHENLARLSAKEPILINLAELHLPEIWVTIIVGRTEASIVHDLSEFFTLPKPVQQPKEQPNGQDPAR